MKIAFVLALLISLATPGFVSAQPATALEQMEVAFVGNPSTSEIRALLDPLMDHYVLIKTNDNYSRCGSVLVALRKDGGPTEMEILRCIKAMGKPAESLKFPDAAALCSVAARK
jgi:hypothetical protein